MFFRGYIIGHGGIEHLNRVAHTLQLIGVPVPRPSVLVKGTTQEDIEKIGVPYLLLTHPGGVPLSDPRFSSDSCSSVNIRHEVGAHLRLLHEVQNDWFGLPSDPGEWSECYSWSECFTLLMENALDAASAIFLSSPGSGPSGNKILTEDDIRNLRQHLSRAIAFYIFDGVEVPSLIWCPSLDWERFVIVKGDRLDDETNFTGLRVSSFTGWEGAIWGDPLMEGAFANPSAELMESYGTELITLYRHKAKRLWYTIYATIVTMTNLKRNGGVVEGKPDETELRKTLQHAMVQLQTAQ